MKIVVDGKIEKLGDEKSDWHVWLRNEKFCFSLQIGYQASEREVQQIVDKLTAGE